MTRDLRFRLLIDNAQFLAGISNAGSGLGGLQRSASSVSFGEFARGAIVLTGVATAARAIASAIQSIPTRGLGFLAETEVTQLGMAGILQSMTEINGRSTTFAQAQDMAAGATQRLQQAAAETAASTGELVETYRSLLGPALAAGMSMQQLERFTVVGTNAVKSMGLPLNQVVQELRSLVSGQINADSSVAKALGIDNADIEKAKTAAGGLFGFLTGKLSGFASASDAYSKTLKGAYESLEEQVTQSSAKAMAPAATAAKAAMEQISEALKGDGIQSTMDGAGRGIATVITTLTSGIGVAQQYGGAIVAVGGAFAAMKVGSIAGDLVRVTAAKMEGLNASRLTIAQAIISGEADDRAVQSSRAKLAALIAEERVKVQTLATEAAVAAAALRTAEAQAMQLTGMQRLAAMEATVLPARQQLALATTAHEAAQQRLTGAIGATSLAARGMGAVMGALGGPIGIAIMALTLLIEKLVSARAEALDAGKVKLSTERVENQLNTGLKVDGADASRLQSELSKAKDQRDELLVEAGKKRSMSDRSPGLMGGKSNVEKLMDELADAERRVQKFEALVGRVNAAQSGEAGGAAVSAAREPTPRERFAAIAANALNVPASAVLAQTALETRHDGSSAIGAFNYGNIKAGSAWRGETADRAVPEQDKAGKTYTEQARFRAYTSPEEAGRDYAALIKSQYPKAVGATNATDFAQGLKDGGYATDTKYVSKVTGAATRYEGNRVGTERGRGTTGAPPSSVQTDAIVGLNAGAGSKAVDTILEKVGGVEQIKKKYADELLALNSAAQSEREAMVRRGASQEELEKRSQQVASARVAIERDMHDKLKAESEKGLGEISQIATATAALGLAKTKAASEERVRMLDQEMVKLEGFHQQGLVSESEYQDERDRIQRTKLTERLAMVDAAAAAENAHKPKDRVETLAHETKLVGIKGERSAVRDDMGKLGAEQLVRHETERVARLRELAADNVQVLQQGMQQVEQMRAQNAAASIGLITDPATKMRAEVAAQITEVRRAAGEVSRELVLRIEVTRGQALRAGAAGKTADQALLTAQADQLEQQRLSLSEQTDRAIELANDGLADRLKPGWQSMLEGWRDTNRLMREASDQTMQGLVTKGEEAFVGFVKTGKLSIKGLADDWIANIARTEFRKFTTGETGSKITGTLAGLVGARPIGKEDAGLIGPTMPESVSKLRDSAGDASAQLRDAASEGGSLAGALKAAGNALGGFGGDLMSAGAQLLSMLQRTGGGGGGSDGGWGSLIAAGVKAWAGGGGTSDAVGDTSSTYDSFYKHALGGTFTSAQRFAAGGAFTNQIVDRDTNFRFRDGGRERLGLMGEAGPEAIMPLSGGGAQAISADGRKLGHVPVQRGMDGRLSVVLGGGSASGAAGPGRMGRFAAGAVIGSMSAPQQLISGASAQLKASADATKSAGDLAIDASTTLNVMDMGKIQQMVSQAGMATERRIFEHLRTVGVMR